MMTVSKKILVLAAHPDDEVLGCGGAMAKHAKAGDEVNVVILAEGLTSRDRHRNRAAHREGLSDLSDAAHRANEILGVASLTLHDFPDNRMDTLDRLEIVKTVEELVAKFRPNIIYTHHIGDVNIDHRRIHEAVVTACRPIPGNPTVEKLIFFETASSTEWQPPHSAPVFTPNLFVDITEFLHLKLAALEAYRMEMRDWPHARSVKALEHLARWRGSNIGVEAAEAFMIGREIMR